MLTRAVLALALSIAPALAGCADGSSGAVTSPMHAGSAAAAQAGPKPKPGSAFRLLQFNVLDGATGDRAAGVVAVIRHSGADVVTLDEVNDEATFRRIAKDTGFHSVYVRANDGYNLGILSRTPIHRCTQFRQTPLRHAAYGCSVTAAGKMWWIFGTHLYPFDESVRAQEAAFIVQQMKLHLPGPVILAGDLNTDSPGETDGMGTLVIPLLRKAGYTDVYRELHSFAKEPGFTASTPPYGAEEHRVDYVFRSGAVRAISARVIDSVAGYTWPSDHKALFVTLGPSR